MNTTQKFKEAQENIEEASKKYVDALFDESADMFSEHVMNLKEAYEQAQEELVYWRIKNESENKSNQSKPTN